MMQIPLFKVYMSPDAPKSVSEVLTSGYIGQGPVTDDFEKNLKSHFNNDYLLTTNSCTSALQLAVHLLRPKSGWGNDDEIIAPPLTCFATISAIIANGVKVKWADVDVNTCNIDLDDVERKLTRNTKAVMVVHWAGCPVDLGKLSRIQEKYYAMYGTDLPVIEDCAHCWNSKHKDKLIGNSGNFCCFSFQSIKFLTTGDGGLLIAPNAKSYKRAKLLRWFGLDRDAGASFRCVQDISESGFKCHCNDIAASIGLSNLPHMDDVVARHRSNAAYYIEELQSVTGVELLHQDPTSEGSFWIFTIKVANRDGFVSHLQSHGIMASPVHARCDKHTCVSEFKSMLPGMDYLENTHVSIPCGWWVTDEERAYIVDCIKEGW